MRARKEQKGGKLLGRAEIVVRRVVLQPTDFGPDDLARDEEEPTEDFDLDRDGGMAGEQGGEAGTRKARSDRVEAGGGET